MLWGFVVVTTSVTKAAKRKVSHQLIISEVLRQQHLYRGVEGDEGWIHILKTIMTGPCLDGKSYWTLRMLLLSILCKKTQRGSFVLKRL